VFSDGVAETAPDGGGAERLADVEVGEMGDRRAEVPYDADPDELPACDGAERDPARVGVVLERASLCVDGVLSAPVRVPGRRVPAPASRRMSTGGRPPEGPSVRKRSS
jgi:hypothetical protein